MKIIGLDLSLTGTGLANSDTSVTHLKTPKSKLDGMARLRFIRDSVLLVTHMAGAQGEEVTVYLEGYSYGSKVGGERLGELGGVVRLALYEAGVPYVEVPPNTLKVFATGKGNAGKYDVLSSAIQRLGYTGSDDNEADALWLWALGMTVHGMAPVDLPKTHLRALEKLATPITAG